MDRHANDNDNNVDEDVGQNVTSDDNGDRVLEPVVDAIAEREEEGLVEGASGVDNLLVTGNEG